jgi:5'-nucleotidase
MRILLTNDDGYTAQGIMVLAEVLAANHQICVFAPDRERSAQSHAMTLRDPLVIRQYDEQIYSCSGTPADCVILTSHGAIPFQPELVISGINRGPNLGTDLVYSGTAAAARQAVMSGIPGIAVSLASYKAPFHYKALARLVAERLPELLAFTDNETFLNINAANAPEDHQYEMAWTGLSRRIYSDVLKTVTAADGSIYCFYTDGRVDTVEQAGSDEHAVRKGMASISRIHIHPQIVAAATGEF